MSDTAWLEKRLRGAGAPVIIDGGMGTQLEKSGVPMDGKVWSSRAVLTHPDRVQKAHEEFIDAGAEVIIANTFAAARHMLEPGGLGEHVKEININAVMLAKQARDNRAEQSVVIAGSVCEWAPADSPKWRAPEAIRISAQEQAEYLAEAGVDFIALEMCQQIDHSIAVIEAAQTTGLPIWIGISAKTHKHSQSLSVFDYEDQSFEHLVKNLAGFKPMMMTIMHTPVPDVSEAQEILKAHWTGPIGIYPESGYFVMPNWQFVDVIEPDELVRAATVWLDNGARLVGGCCGLGPEHIAAFRKHFCGAFEDS